MSDEVSQRVAEARTADAATAALAARRDDAIEAAAAEAAEKARADMEARLPPIVKAPRAAALRKQLEAERDRLQAELKPHREYLDAAAADPKLVAARAEVKRINAALFPVLNELAALARAGGAKSIAAEPGEYLA